MRHGIISIGEDQPHNCQFPSSYLPSWLFPWGRRCVQSKLKRIRLYLSEQIYRWTCCPAYRWSSCWSNCKEYLPFDVQQGCCPELLHTLWVLRYTGKASFRLVPTVCQAQSIHTTFGYFHTLCNSCKLCMEFCFTWWWPCSCLPNDIIDFKQFVVWSIRQCSCTSGWTSFSYSPRSSFLLESLCMFFRYSSNSPFPAVNVPDPLLPWMYYVNWNGLAVNHVFLFPVFYFCQSFARSSVSLSSVSAGLSSSSAAL